MKQIIKTLGLALGVISFSVGTMAADVDMKNSKFVWKVDKKLGPGHTGELKLKSAKADIKNGKIKSGEFVMDMKNFTVTDLSGKWAKKFLDHVRSGDFFEANKYTEAKLVVKKQVGTDKVQGDLTIKNKTLPVTIDFKKTGKKYTGKFVFDRTKWGITYGSGSFFKALKADKIIKDEIELTFDVAVK